MAAPLLLRGTPLLRLRLHHRHQLAVGLFAPSSRTWCTTAESHRFDENVSSSAAEKSTAAAAARVWDPPKYSSWDNPDNLKWHVHEKEILDDVEPTIELAKEILHSGRYMDGERLTNEDEKLVVEKLLAYHPNSEDKTGCGLDSIMVDRHPHFKRSRCLFVVRTDGAWIDFSYQKCIRAYLREKYPTYAERFIREHLKRGR